MQPKHEQKLTHLERHHEVEQQNIGGSYAPPNLSCGYHQKPWFHEPPVSQPVLLSPHAFCLYNYLHSCIANQIRIVRWGKTNHFFYWACLMPVTSLASAAEEHQSVRAMSLQSQGTTHWQNKSIVKCKLLLRAQEVSPASPSSRGACGWHSPVHTACLGLLAPIQQLLGREVPQKRRNTGSLGPKQGKEEAMW